MKKNAIAEAARANKCTFWAGGTLTGLTKSKTNGPVIGQYVFNVVPKQATVDPQTAWDLTSIIGGESVSMQFDVNIAGESVVYNKKQGIKYSFSLIDGLGASRVTDLVVMVDETPYYPAHTVTVDNPDFMYWANAGTFGVTTLLKDGDTMANILALNQYSSTDPIRNSHVAVVDPVIVDLGVGSHTVTVTGTVKGNDGSASISFTGTAYVTISAENCSK